MGWIGPVAQAGIGLVQTMQAQAAADQLPDPKEYTVGTQLQSAEGMAFRRAEQGYSPAERTMFEQGMARRTGAAERSLRNLGLAGLGVGMSNIFNIDAMNQFSAQSEAERRKGETLYAGIANQIQGVQDREVASFNQMLMAQQQALGGAAASGLENTSNAIGMGAQMANTNKLAEQYGTSGIGGWGDYMSLGSGGAGFSDKRLKYNIIELGKSPLGIPIYSFKYKGGSVSYKGTMAQDLINMGLNDAVTVMSNGYYGVYYDMIDVDMELLN